MKQSMFVLLFALATASVGFAQEVNTNQEMNSQEMMTTAPDNYVEEDLQQMVDDSGMDERFRPAPVRPMPPHGGPVRPGPGPVRPGPGPLRPGPGPVGPGHWGPRPGWHDGWHFDRAWHPGWFRPGIRFPAFVWISVPAGYWQCTAFNQGMQAFSDVGTTADQAAYDALYACGGPNYQAVGCYVPAGYCQVR